MVEGEALHDDFAILIGDNPAIGRQVGRGDPCMGICETLHVGQFPVLRRRIIEGLPGRQVFSILGHRAILDVNRERHAGTFSINLRNAVPFDSIK